MPKQLETFTLNIDIDMRISCGAWLYVHMDTLSCVNMFYDPLARDIQINTDERVSADRTCARSLHTVQPVYLYRA